MLKLEKENGKITIESYSIRLVSIGILFALAGLLAILFGKDENDLQLIDHVIYFSVCFISIVIHSFKKIEVNGNDLIITSRSLLGTKTHFLKRSEIATVAMAYGKGSYARGGSIRLDTKNEESYVLVSYDLGQRKNIERLLENVKPFL